MSETPNGSGGTTVTNGDIVSFKVLGNQIAAPVVVGTNYPTSVDGPPGAATLNGYVTFPTGMAFSEYCYYL